MTDKINKSQNHSVPPDTINLPDTHKALDGRRTFLNGLGLAACTLLVPSKRLNAAPVERTLKEADFYRRHKWAG